MPLLTDIGLLVTCASPDGQADIGGIPDAVLAWEGGTIAWAGPADALPATYASQPSWSAEGRLVVPGLVDCHTHLAFGGWRADEFTRRIRGATYLEIARGGGGIAATVAATRDMDDEKLLDRCRCFTRDMVSLGVTTIEAKSGYGLDLENELRLLRMYRELDEAGPLRVVSTCLAAHVVPPEMRGARDEYVALVVREILPAVASEDLAEFCDVFVEEGAFSADEAREILAAARGLGLGAKLHADQLSDGNGAALAAELGAISADHLERVSASGIAAMADAGVVGVTLPLATLYLDQAPPPARAMIEAGAAVAVATDFNPGSAPSYHLPLALTLACTRQRMTPAEALKGATRYAARAIGREDRAGVLEAGRPADFAVMDAPDVDHWLYHHRANACLATVIGGEVAWGGLGRA